MHFDLDDQQKALRDMLHDFFAARFGDAQGVEAIADGALDPELWQAIGALGLAGAMVPAEQGGLGLDLLTAAVVAETAGRFAVPAPIVPTMLAVWLIAAAGSEAQRQAWLPRLMEGGAAATFALAEEGGWLVEDWRLSGNPLSGTKRFVERADAAGLIVVGLAGGALGLVEAPAPQVVARPIDTLDRTRPLFDVDFEATAIDLLPAGEAHSARLVDALLVCGAADALGAAFAAQARAVDYAKERRQFGQPIGAFQALKHQLADLSVELEPARPLCWYAAHAWDTGHADAPRMASLAKAHVGEIAVNAARAAIEAQGGIAYTWEYPAHLFLKRAMHDRAMLGGIEVHRERVASLAGW